MGFRFNVDGFVLGVQRLPFETASIGIIDPLTVCPGCSAPITDFWMTWFQISGFEIRYSVSGFRVSVFGSRVSGLGFRVSGVGCRVPGVGFRISGFGFRVSGFGFRGSDFGCRLSGFGSSTMLAENLSLYFSASSQN